MLQLHREMALRQPVLLCAFTGWSDAASGASGVLNYLLMKWPGSELASFDPEVIYSYTVTRPSVRLRGQGQRELRWPALTWTALPLPHAACDLVLLLGPEPDLRWQGCAQAAVDLAMRLGVERAVGLGCFYALVAHTAPVPLVGTSPDRALRATLAQLGLGETNYQGPTGFLTALLDALHRAGIASAGIWGAAPSYLPGIPNPKVSAALLGAVERLLQVDLGRTELEIAARDLERRIDEALRERPDLRAFVERLRAGQAGTPPAPAAPPSETAPAEDLPSADAVLKDLEEYLRNLRRSQEDQ
jgi:hypothetical protein